MNPSVIKQLRHFGDLQQNAPLNEYTTFKTGGPAELFMSESRADRISEIIKAARLNDVPVTIIGGGSNLLVGDLGIQGLVLRIAGGAAEDAITSADSGICCNACVSKSELIRFCIEYGYGGIEFMAGIPGSVGGGIFMNAGTFMGSFSDIVDRVETVDFDGNRQIVNISRESASYRDIGLGHDHIITSAYLNLAKTDDIKYLKNRIDEIIRDRNMKHPVTFPSAGSVFKNPDGLSSWKLVRDCGFSGKRTGGAEVSSLHTNFIINSGGASSLDIKLLIEEIQQKVMQQFGVALETEIKMVGRF